MLPSHCHQRVRVAEQADLTAVRGVAADLAAAAGLGEQAAGRVQLVVSELATNLLRHATGGGMVLLRALEPPGGVECLALDQGPGIADLGLALADRKVVEPAAGEGLGYGLGAVRRLSDLFDIHSAPGVGTAVLSRVRAAAGHTPFDRAAFVRPAFGHPAFDWGAAMLPIPGGDHCGDGFLVRTDGLVVVADGLGHGEPASLAARRAEEVARHAAPEPDPQAVLAAAHEALRGTRGAAVAVLRATPGRIDYAGVGNIAATVVRGNSASALPERWGVVGYNAAPPRTMSVIWEPGDHVLLSSDGCSRIADLFVERCLRHVAPALAAAVLLRDGTARVDDQTVVVLRHQHPDRAATAGPDLRQGHSVMARFKRILVVDDSKLARMALKAVLSDIGTGGHVEEAADAEAAFEMLGRGEFDIVFLDYNMPGTDGISAAGVIRGRLPVTAIALVTANAQDAILAEAERLGVRFIPKPVRRQDVARFLLDVGHSLQEA